MAEHPIQGLMKTAMDSIKGMVDVNTVVGDPVETQDGNLIIPVSRVSFGFAAGGAEYSGGNSHMEDGGEFPFGGGSGAGVSVAPVGFLVVGGDKVKMLPVSGEPPLDRLIDLTPKVLEHVQARCKRGQQGTGAQQGNSPQQNANPQQGAHTHHGGCCGGGTASHGGHVSATQQVENQGPVGQGTTGTSPGPANPPPPGTPQQ